MKAHERTVSFHPFVTVRKVLHLNNYTDDEFYNSYYTSNELAWIQEENEVTIQLQLNEQLDKNDDLYCFRGLESKTLSGTKAKVHTRQKAWDVVMTEQSRQGSEDIDKRNPRVISLLYRRCGQKSITNAYKIGLQDQNDSLGNSTELYSHTLQDTIVSPVWTGLEDNDFPLSLCMTMASERKRKQTRTRTISTKKVIPDGKIKKSQTRTKESRITSTTTTTIEVSNVHVADLINAGRIIKDSIIGTNTKQERIRLLIQCQFNPYK